MEPQENINKQKQRWFGYLIWLILSSISIFVLYLSTKSIVSAESISFLEFLLYLIINLFVIGTSLYFCFAIYKDLSLEYREDGIKLNSLFSQKLIKWENIRKITVHEVSGHPFKFEIESDEKKFAIVTLFYKKPLVLFEFLKSVVGAETNWIFKELK